MFIFLQKSGLCLYSRPPLSLNKYTFIFYVLTYVNIIKSSLKSSDSQEEVKKERKNGDTKPVKLSSLIAGINIIKRTRIEN